jgi:hypothetical protein
MKNYLIFLIGLVLISGCTLLGDDSKNINTDGWEKATIPADLKSTWNYPGGAPAITIESSSVTYQNRIWLVRDVQSKNDTLRVVLFGETAWIAFYFKNIQPQSVEWGLGQAQISMILAKLEEPEEYITLHK